MTNPTEQKPLQSQTSELTDEIPEARVEPASASAYYVSRMWWATLACLLVAIAIVWWSLPERGLQITIQFPEGHGLREEDDVLYRGILVGTVEQVRLNPDNDGVDVTVNLKPSASDLAREGTRFWIVRPQVSIAGISGLDTAVGHKYVSLAPGPNDGSRQTRFIGLVDPPPEDASQPGIEIIIRGDKRYSVSPGSTVSFRGVEVGRILSVGLSQDTRYVDIRAKVFDRYRSFLTTETKFWATSGVDFDFSLSEGLKLDTESLATIAQGGVSFLTISSGGEPISSGHVFRLYARPEDKWLESANSVYSSGVELKGVVQVQKRWRKKSLIGERKQERTFNAVPVPDGNRGFELILPTNALQPPEKAIEGSVEYFLIGDAGEFNVTQAVQDTDRDADQLLISRIVLPAQATGDWLAANSSFRLPGALEDGLAVRSIVEDGKRSYFHYQVEKQYLTDDWKLTNFDGDADLWNGSPLISTEDGSVIGILVTSEEGAEIARLDSRSPTP